MTGRRPAEQTRTPPLILSMNDLDDYRQGLVDRINEWDLVAALASIPPYHRLAVAARLALEDAAKRDARARAVREAGKDIHGGDTAYWRKTAAHSIPYEEMRRRRAIPSAPPRPAVA